MSILGINANTFVNVAAQAALGAATGGVSVSAMAAQTLTSTMGAQFIGGVAQTMGLPPEIGQMAAGIATGNLPAAAEDMGQATTGLAESLNVSASDAGPAADDVTEAVSKLAVSVGESPDAKAAKSGGTGQSWLMALAEALGKKLDKMAADMSTMADQITDKTPSMTAKFSAKTQEFGILMNAATNAIKTIGEAEANSARKG